jgi:hypothetical protein
MLSPNVSGDSQVNYLRNDIIQGHTAGGAVVKALCYKPIGRGIDSRRRHGIFR